MKLGAQLYTVRKQMKTPEDIERGLGRIAKIGYKCIQVSGIGDIRPLKLREICDRLGLEIVITHTNPDEYRDGTEQTVLKHNILGCKYIGLGAMPKDMRTHDTPDTFVNLFRPKIREFARKGKIFSYHNHQFEFEKKDGVMLLDRLLTAIPEMMVTLDCYWVNYGGADVCDTIDRLAGRIDCVHLKDYGIVDSEIRMFPVGEGNMNYPKILEHMKKAGVKYAFVEQDDCYGRDPFECLEQSYNYLKGYFEE